MLNCQQVKSIFAATQEELEDLLNEALRKLWKRVQHIDFVNPLVEGYGVNIVYWSQDIEATMTYKLETLPEEPMATDESALFVAVLHECQRDLVYRYLKEHKDNETVLLCEQDLFDRTIERFAPETEEQLDE